MCLVEQLTLIFFEVTMTLRSTEKDRLFTLPLGYTDDTNGLLINQRFINA